MSEVSHKELRRAAHSVLAVAASIGNTASMSPYEERRWRELQAHWEKKATRKELVPAKARQALESATSRARDLGGKATERVGEWVPQGVKDVGEAVADATLLRAANGAVRLLNLTSEWAAELTDRDRVLQFHRDRGRDAESLKDLRQYDLEHCDELTRRLALKWSTFGAVEGAAIGVLGTVPVAGGLAAVTVDVLAMHVLSTAIATRATYAYGFDATDPAERHMVDRMVRRAYTEQASKVEALRRSRSAFQAARTRTRWSDKLRKDQKLMAAVENLMKQFADGQHIPVERVARAIPGIAIVVGASSNAFMLGDITRQASLYGQTRFLADKYGLELPANLAKDHEQD